MDEERLAKLNSYLISKGKRPKQIKNNFVKSNIRNVKKLPLNKNLNLLNENKAIDRGLTKKNPVNLKKIEICKEKGFNKTIQKNFDNSKTINKNNLELINEPKKCPPKTPNKHFRKSLRKSAALNLSYLQKKTGNSISIKQCSTPKTAEKLRKKLIRRSVTASIQKTRQDVLRKNENSGNELKPCCNLATPNKKNPPTYGGSKSVQPSLRFASRIVEKRNKTPGRKKSLILSQKRGDRMEKLRSWMTSRGKNPDHLRGFKPVKTYLTPTNSPSTTKPLTPGASLWPTLRGEDYFNELSILVKNSMDEASACLNNGCSAQEVFDLLTDFKERVTVAEEHAAYWVTFAHVHEIFGNTEDEIIEIYENAVKKQAKPIYILKEELQNFLERIANNERLTEKTDHQFIHSNDKTTSQHQGNTSVKNLPHPKLSQSDHHLDSQPVSNFKTPNKQTIELATPSPSSIIKLRMVSKSSPLFKQLVARKALPLDAEAIVTPVRRSRRIENLTPKYPRVVQGHDPCVTTPHELMKNQPAKTSCNFVFDSNDALAGEFNDLSKLLHL